MKEAYMPLSPQPMMILLVQPADETARRVFDLGHVPIDVADLVRTMSPPPPSTSSFAREMAARLLLHCAAVLCVPGASTEADMIVERARWEGKPVFRHHDELPRPHRT